MQQDARLLVPEIRVDGGAASPAGLVTVVWSSEANIAVNWQAGTRFTPDMPSDRRGKLDTGWRRAVERAKGWAAPELTNP
jgi:glycerol kinase